MKYAGHINYKIQKLSSGRWLALYNCPATGCGVEGSATSANELGPYDGRCGRGHEMHAPSITKTSPN